jgi:excisionase family DNA binding protein
MEQLLNIRQVAEYLNVSPRTVRRLVARKALPCYRFGRVLRFRAGDVGKWLDGRKED